MLVDVECTLAAGVCEGPDFNECFARQAKGRPALASALPAECRRLVLELLEDAVEARELLRGRGGHGINGV